MFTHYGCVTTKWFPAKSHGALTAADITNSIAPLAPYVSKLLIPRGMRGMNEWTQANSGPGHGRGQGNDPPLERGPRSHLTLQPVTPNTNDPFSFDTGDEVERPGRSAARWITSSRSRLSPNRNPAVHSGWATGSTTTPVAAISYVKAPGTAAAAPRRPLHSRATARHPSIFSATDGSCSRRARHRTPDSYAVARGKKITNLVKDDLATLKRMEMSAADRNKIEVWASILTRRRPS